MDPKRDALHELLLSLMPEGSKNVYFQPPPSLQMLYPCIRYQRDDIRVQYADNVQYKGKKRYLLTIITKDVDSEIPSTVAKLPYCSFDRFFTTESLNHDVFNLYF